LDSHPAGEAHDREFGLNWTDGKGAGAGCVYTAEAGAELAADQIRVGTGTANVNANASNNPAWNLFRSREPRDGLAWSGRDAEGTAR
jgi:hypothetical protein